MKLEDQRENAEKVFRGIRNPSLLEKKGGIHLIPSNFIVSNVQRRRRILKVMLGTEGYIKKFWGEEDSLC